MRLATSSERYGQTLSGEKGADAGAAQLVSVGSETLA